MKKAFKLIGLIIVSLLLLILLVISYFYFTARLREVKTNVDAAPSSGRLVETEGGKIFIQEMGPAEGRPVVFIHGSLAWSETWKEVIEVVSKQGYRTIAIDLPPFGFSERPETPSYSTKDQALRIIQLVQALKLQKPIVVGHSFGGSPTTEAVMMSPELFGALVLVDAAVDPSPDLTEENNDLLKAFLSNSFVRDPIIASTLTNPFLTRYLLQKFLYDPGDATDKIVAVYQQPLILKNSTNAVGNWLPSLIFKETGLLNQSAQNYKELKMPVLLIWGDKDTITPPSLAEELKDLIPNSQLTILKDVGHIPQIENSGQLNEALIKGLELIVK